MSGCTLCKKDINFFNKAKEEAELSSFTSSSRHQKIRIGCVAVYKGKIISKGHNMKKTHPMQTKFNKIGIIPFRTRENIFLDELHAEVDCLRKIYTEDIVWKDVSLYVYRLTNDNRIFGLAKPCKGCSKLIRSLGIENIYYTGNRSLVYEKIIY